MTLGFFLLTAGAALIYTGFTNQTLTDLALARPGPGQPDPIVDAGALLSDGTSTAVGKGAAATTTAVNRTVSGVGNWRGTPVAKWMLPILKKAVAAGWDGCLSSGYRTPAESEAICQRQCGAPSCHNCAGRTSNHSGKRYPGGAIDVCDPAGFQAAMDKIGKPLKNSLDAGDPEHYSVSGR